MKRILPVLAMAVVLAGCGDDNSKTASNTATTPASPTVTNTPYSMNYLGTLAAADKQAVKTVDVASLNKALSEFNVQEGRFPKTLQELVPSYIAHVPEAPFGYKLNYDATAGEVTVTKVAQ